MSGVDRAKTIGDFLNYLERNDKPPVIQEHTIGKQLLTTYNGVVVSRDADGKIIKPISDYIKFSIIFKDLGFFLHQDINQQSSLNKTTLLIKVTTQNDLSLAIALLNFGADPSICDSENNNALMHAAKLGRVDILKEFGSMIQAKEAKHEEKEAEAISAPAQSFTKETKVEPIRSSSEPENKDEDADIQQRVVLRPDVIFQKNNASESVLKLMTDLQNKFKAKAKPVKRAAADASRSAADVPQQSGNELSQFKALLHEIEEVCPKAASVPFRVREEKSAPTKPAISTTVDTHYQDKIDRMVRPYDRLVHSKFCMFAAECKAITFTYINLDPTKERDRLRDEKVKVGDKTPVEVTLPATFSVDYEDQARVRAALALIKDYYAPESAPISSGWNSLRRLFTGHTGRRYCKEAEALYKMLSKKPLATVDNIVDIYTIICDSVEVIRNKSHDKKNTNNIFNSSYTRRLFYIREMLKKTEAYKCKENNLPESIYITGIEEKYKLKGLLNA